MSDLLASIAAISVFVLLSITLIDQQERGDSWKASAEHWEKVAIGWEEVAKKYEQTANQSIALLKKLNDQAEKP